MRAALVTGASGGIGEAFARRLAADGHNLFLAARSADRLRKLCEEVSTAHNITAHYLAIDLSEDGADLKVFNETSSLGIEVDWLVNNAGFGSMGDFAKLDGDREASMVRLNALLPVALTHRYLPEMRKRKSGVIINVSSAAGFQPIPFMATYAATKAFLSSFSEAVAEENRPYGVRILALCPGPTSTKFFDAGNIEAFAAKGTETPEQVVETALRAVTAGKSKAVSGWRNRVVAGAASMVPNSIVTRVIAWSIRDRNQS